MSEKFVKAMLVHLGTNMWYEEGNMQKGGKTTWEIGAESYLRFDFGLWREYTEKLAEAGVNTIVLDIGDGIIYDSHPELAIDGSLSKEALKIEVDRLKDMGISVIPKLNFSTCHDIWLKEYSRMVSTPKYYEVCRDLIVEICDLLHPEYFHLGMDEENYAMQKGFNYIVIRNNDLWWHDLYYLCDCVRECSAIPCIWADRVRDEAEDYIKKCPKDIIQCPWFYADTTDESKLADYQRAELKAIRDLNAMGYKIFTASSNCFVRDSLPATLEYCKEHIAPENNFGIMMSSWFSLTKEWWHKHLESIEVFKECEI